MRHGILVEGMGEESGKDPYFCGIRDGLWICYMWMSKQNTLLLVDFRILPDR